MGIIAGFLLLLVFISFGVFVIKPSGGPSMVQFNKPKVAVDLKIFDSDQFKNLDAFPQMQMQFSYKAMAKDGKTQSGFISAASEDDAKIVLTNMGLTVSEIKESEIGRDNPFTPYYQSSLPSAVTNTKAAGK